MKRLGLSIQTVKAIFISHEHTDHIKGVPVIAKKYNLPVYITKATLMEGRLCLEEPLVKEFRAFEPVHVGSLAITAFPKQHDASEPHSFIVSGSGVNIGVFTDIGVACEHVAYHFRQCHAAFLEANYDEQLLSQGSYPYFLKKRITGEKGHLSNTQALELFTSCKPAFMSHLFLSHLSKDNNCPHLVKELFDKHANGTEIIVASRFEETAVYHITSS